MLHNGEENVYNMDPIQKLSPNSDNWNYPSFLYIFNVNNRPYYFASLQPLLDFQILSMTIWLITLSYEGVLNPLRI